MGRLHLGARPVRNGAFSIHFVAPGLNIMRGRLEVVADFLQLNVQPTVEIPSDRRELGLVQQVVHLVWVALVVEEQPRAVQTANIRVAAGADGAVLPIERPAAKRGHGHVKSRAAGLLPPAADQPGKVLALDALGHGNAG